MLTPKEAADNIGLPEGSAFRKDIAFWAFHQLYNFYNFTDYGVSKEETFSLLDQMQDIAGVSNKYELFHAIQEDCSVCLQWDALECIHPEMFKEEIETVKGYSLAVVAGSVLMDLGYYLKNGKGRPAISWTLGELSPGEKGIIIHKRTKIS